MDANGKPRRNSLRRWRWYIAGGVAVFAIAAMFAGTGVLSALTTHPSNAAAPDPKFTCPGDKILTVSLTNPPTSYHATIAMSLTWKVVNDEDRGFAGYWAMDTNVSLLHVWFLKAGPFAGLYYALETYKGNFQVPQGALSPGVTGTTPNAIPEPAPGYGTLVGGWAGFVNPDGGTFNAAGLQTFGNLGTMNYGGTTSDLLLTTGQTGDATPFDWVTAYFGASASSYFGDSGYAWGWVYTLNSLFQTNPAGSTTSVNQWCIFGTGNYGDIVTAA
jgi:hypothetical protein